MAVVINSGAGGDLNPGFGGGGPVATAIAVVRKAALITSLGDALSAQVTYGWDQVSGSARIVTPSSSGSPGDGVTVSMGILGGNLQQCFGGTLRETDTTLAPHSVTAACKGPLYALEEYEQPSEVLDDSGKPGLDFQTLTGSTTGATLRQIVAAVLDHVGVSYSLTNFDNPSPVYGLIAPENFTWSTGETAAAYLHRILEASAGYRLFDSADGQVYLKQITAIPGDAQTTFTLGKDIFGDSTSQDSSLGQRGAVLVNGYDDGSGPATSGIVGSGLIFRVKSALIETDALATTIANYWQPIVSRRQQIVRLTTPRDDFLGPATTIAVDGFGGGSNMWLKSVTREIAPNGQFTQHLVCVAGGSST